MAARRFAQTSQTHRDRLVSLIESNPGIHIRRLSHLTGLSWNTCLHHLRSMERKQVVTSRKVNGKVCWFDSASGAYKGKTGTCLLRDPENLRLAKQVLQNPGDNQAGIAGNLGMAASVVHRRLAKLEDAGLIVRMPHQRSVCVFPSEELVPLAERAGLIRPERPSPHADGANPLQAPGVGGAFSLAGKASDAA